MISNDHDLNFGKRDRRLFLRVEQYMILSVLVGDISFKTVLELGDKDFKISSSNPTSSTAQPNAALSIEAEDTSDFPAVFFGDLRGYEGVGDAC
jgi:hypothetical protein